MNLELDGSPAPGPSCHSCGCPVAPAIRFCPDCGTLLEVLAPIQVPVPEPAPPAASRLTGPVLQSPRDPSLKPEQELSETERAERWRQHQAAVAAGRQDPGIQGFVQPPPGAQTVLIHMVEDGLTAFGLVWFRGQELEISPQDPRWPSARKWIFMDDSAQMQRWGKVKFRPGPWPGLRTYRAGRAQPLRALSGDGVVSGPGLQEIMQAEQMEARRGRGIPVAPRF
jgi:hypothetical protein